MKYSPTLWVALLMATAAIFLTFKLCTWACNRGQPDPKPVTETVTAWQPAQPERTPAEDSIARVRLAAQIDSMHLADVQAALDYLQAYSQKENEGREAQHYLSTCERLDKYAALAVRHEADENEKVRKAALILKKKMPAFRVKTMPFLRRQWAAAADSKLWERDVDVRVYGKSGTTLELIGGLFAANANIKAVQERIQDAVYLLRFKRVNYKWYSGASEYEYFEIKSPPDSEF